MKRNSMGANNKNQEQKPKEQFLKVVLKWSKNNCLLKKYFCAIQIYPTFV